MTTLLTTEISVTKTEGNSKQYLKTNKHQLTVVDMSYLVVTLEPDEVLTLGTIVTCLSVFSQDQFRISVGGSVNIDTKSIYLGGAVSGSTTITNLGSSNIEITVIRG
jgi:hypothetical protein